MVRPYVHLPKFDAAARARTSLMLRKETFRSYHQCTNTLCGQSFTTLKSAEDYLINVTSNAKAHIIPAGVVPKSHYGEHQLELMI